MTLAAFLVLIFIRTDCPIANRYAPELQNLFERYGSRGFDFKLIYAEPGHPEFVQFKQIEAIVITVGTSATN